MPTIQQIIQQLEILAPPSYQESYDNAGLITGRPEWELTGALVSLDATEDIVAEAIRENCNLIIAHHPIVFKGLKKLNGNNYVERTIISAIQHQIAIYAIHTNLDNVAGGVNFKIAQKLKLEKVKILAPKKQVLQKLVTFVPLEHTTTVLNALYEAGAGNIGNYSHCSFRSKGSGTFLPNEQANPHTGQPNKPEEVQEERIEVILPAYLSHKVIAALQQSHPYEEVAYYLTALENAYQNVGAGIIGQLAEPMDDLDFLHYLKAEMQVSCVRHTARLHKPVQRIALCGGAGIFLLPDALRQKADVFITADVKYHEFFDAEGKLILADIGHYESEVFTKELIATYLSEKFRNIALILSKTVTNPINYL
ncbi:Nif3-like dinuclear metal center hexameric protein [Rhodocytophaga rosea]|uniref:GTP cyclohydrolase 1 type 2 homolog n=1 Tax=Rhodocytophaga rosea TaxID=2704465 RepID=A0A6C0GUP4_9BACT|nr:Nif3-like dinuclear metal center hexameric protein [Rhodocytophaga rosea]QHT71587.1 Nif3-like dinuclear metal center hexameric protein [Rhodocytophaga rosea]